MLPGALDAGLCARAREQMWQTLSAAIPGMTPDPATWPRDLASARNPPPPETERDPYLTVSAKGFHIYAAAEPLFLDMFPLALFPIVEQLCGAGSMVRPSPPDADGLCRGEMFIAKNGHDHKMLDGLEQYAHLKDDDLPPMRTEDIAVVPTSPQVGNIHGGR